MNHHWPIVVVKVGGSVLRTPDDLPIVVQDIYQDVRCGRRVVVVVSAFAGTTDALLHNTTARFRRPPDQFVARVLETGEALATSLLAIQLDEMGVPVSCLDAHTLGLETVGPYLDAEPLRLDVDTVRRALDEAPVVVVSGFVGRSAREVSLLGRGGSDLTALFLAYWLNASHCRLLKDVHGLHPRDTTLTMDRSKFFAAASWSDVEEHGGGVVQQKALHFSRLRQQPFAIQKPNVAVGTKVGSLNALIEQTPANNRLRIALAGLGTVGHGVHHLLTKLPDQFEVVGVLLKDRNKPRDLPFPTAPVFTDPSRLLETQPDILVETLGGVDPAWTLIRQAIDQHIGVVTANKAVVAMSPDLLELSATKDAVFKCSSAVGGAVPMLELTESVASTGSIRGVEGILNGTCNYVLDEVAKSGDLDHAVHQAQQLGLAEADPSADLSGLDTVHKLAILATRAFGQTVPVASITCQGIDTLAPHDFAEAAQSGNVIRLVGRARWTPNGIVAEVSPQILPEQHVLAQIQGENNALVLYPEDGAPIMIKGKGAGRWPTSASVLGDIIELSRVLDPSKPTQAPSSRAT